MCEIQECPMYALRYGSMLLRSAPCFIHLYIRYVANVCPYGIIRTNRKTHYYQGCSGVVKRAYDTKYRNKNVYITICCCFLKTKKSMSNLNQRGFSDLPPFFFHYNTPFGGGRLGGDKEPFHIKDKRAATR